MRIKYQNMTREKLANTENLLGRLLSRQVFLWPGEETPITVGEKISGASRQEAQSKIDNLNASIVLNAEGVIAKIALRAATWQFESLLDHTLLKRRVYRLSSFSN